MANIKITDLTAYGNPTSTDVLPIVDVGADVTKKVSIADLFKNAASGTESLPGIAFDGDPNTGIYSPGADQVALSTNGTGRLFVDSAGLVGIGTSSPEAKLEISNDVQATTSLDTTAIKLSNNFDGGSGIEFVNAVAGKSKISFGVESTGAGTDDTYLGFSTCANAGALTERLRITSAGLVGIGTTSPGGLLHLNRDDSNDAKFIIENDDGQFSIIANNNTAEYLSSEHIFLSASGATEKARLDSSGRLLVGTSTSLNVGTTIAGLLQVANTNVALGSITTFDASANGGYLTFGNSRGTSIGSYTVVNNNDRLGTIRFAGSDGTDLESVGAQIEAQVDGTPGANDMPGRLVFSVTADGESSPTERMRINKAGSQQSFSANDVYRAASQQGAGTSFGFYYGYHSATTTQNGTLAYLVYTNGNVVNANNSYGATSDIKLKENIVDANSQWDDIKALQVRNYNFKEGQTHTQIGLIAQEVELVSPGLVSESPDRDAEGNDLGTVTKSVNYSVLYMKAVKALQEAMERIETLEAKVAALEGA